MSRYSADSPAVRDFIAAAEENRSQGEGVYGFRGLRAENRRKYIAIDEDLGGQWSGRFLVDREDGTVYGIRGYGQRGHYIGTLASLAAQYREATRSHPYIPHSGPRAHSETGRAGVVRHHQPRLEERASRVEGGPVDGPLLAGGPFRRKGFRWLRPRSRQNRRLGR